MRKLSSSRRSLRRRCAAHTSLENSSSLSYRLLGRQRRRKERRERGEAMSSFKHLQKMLNRRRLHRGALLPRAPRTVAVPCSSLDGAAAPLSFGDEVPRGAEGFLSGDPNMLSSGGDSDLEALPSRGGKTPRNSSGIAQLRLRRQIRNRTPGRKITNFWKLSLLRKVICYISQLKRVISSAPKDDTDVSLIQSELRGLTVT